MLIAVASAKGAPGTTTTALALALGWPRPVILADLDARGGDVMWTYGQGQDTGGRGVLGLQVASRHQPWASAVWSQLVTLADAGPQRWLLPGLEEPQHAGSIDWTGLAASLASLPVDVIADCGAVRAMQAPTPVWAAAHLMALVVRPTLASIHAARTTAALVRNDLRDKGFGADRLGSIVVGPGRPYPKDDVAQSLSEIAQLYGDLPWDPRTAAVLGEGTAGGRKLASSSLMRGAATLGHLLGGRALELSPDSAASASPSGSGEATLRAAVSDGH